MGEAEQLAVITLFPTFAGDERKKKKSGERGKAITCLLLSRGEILTDCSSAPLLLALPLFAKSLGRSLS